MSDAIYNKFWELVGKERPAGHFENYHDLVQARRSATVAALRASDQAKAQAIIDAFTAIGGEEAHRGVMAARASALGMQYDPSAFVPEVLLESRIAAAAKGLGTTLADGWRSLRDGAKNLWPTKAATAVAPAIVEAAPATPRQLGAILPDLVEEAPSAFRARYTRPIPLQDRISYAAQDMRAAAGDAASNAGAALSRASNSASKGLDNLSTRAKGLIPQRIPSLGEPMAETATNLARGAALAPIPDSTHVILTAEQMARLQPPPIPTTLRAAPVAPARVAQAPVLTDVVEEVLPDIHQKIKRGKSPIGEQIRDAFSTMRRAGSEALGKLKGRFTKTPTAEPIIEPAAEAAAPPRVLHTPAEKSAIVDAANAAMRTGTGPIQRSAKEMAKITKDARASFKPKGRLFPNAIAAIQNGAEWLVSPITHRLSPKDPYKILGITTASSPEVALNAFNTKLYALGERRLNSPNAQHAMNQLHEAFETVHPDLVERAASTLRAGSAGFAHGGKLLLAGGVVAAAAVGYFANRKPEKQPIQPVLRPRNQGWTESLQQPANAEIQR